MHEGMLPNWFNHPLLATVDKDNPQIISKQKATTEQNLLCLLNAICSRRFRQNSKDYRLQVRLFRPCLKYLCPDGVELQTL